MTYFTKDTALPPFIPLPRFLLQGEYSINAKLLYGLILNRTMLSRKSGWYAENGAVYVIYTIRQMANDLNRSERTVKTALAELENAGLIQRVRQGWNRANHIFLKLPEQVQLSSPPEGNPCPMDGQETSSCIVQTLPTSNTDTSKKNLPKTENRESALRLGEYQNVFLSDEQLRELQGAYPGKWEEYIGRLSRYMEIHKKQYANHYATLKSWLQEDAAKAPATKYDYYYHFEEGECL